MGGTKTMGPMLFHPFSYGLGCVIVGLGLLIALHPVFPQVDAFGSFLVTLMAEIT
jgi:hypothetical protein